MEEKPEIIILKETRCFLNLITMNVHNLKYQKIAKQF